MEINSPNNLLFITAMDVEYNNFISKGNFKTIPISTKLNISVSEMSFSGGSIFITKTGIGLVNAGISLALICQQYDIKGVIVMGVGGALHKDLAPGDTVIADKVIQHDSLISYADKNELMASGLLFLSLQEADRTNPYIQTNSELNQMIKDYLIEDSKKFFFGNLASGSEFVANLDRKKYLHHTFDSALLVDMETAAIAQLSRDLKIPFSVIKTVADRLEPNTNKIHEDYVSFLEFASDKAGYLFDRILNKLITNVNSNILT